MCNNVGFILDSRRVVLLMIRSLILKEGRKYLLDVRSVYNSATGVVQHYISDCIKLVSLG